MLKNDVELNFRSDEIAVALTALQLQWELATRITFINKMRPFRYILINDISERE